MNKKLTFGLGLAVASLMAGILIGCGGNSKEYTITFNTNGGSPVEPLKVKWGDTPNMPDDPIKAGYTFIDWFKDEGLTSVYVPAPVETDFTLYAKWSINSYTVSFESNGGTPIAPVTGNFGSTINRDDVRPSKDYYVFDNWYTDPEFTKEFDYHIPSVDMTVFARWVPNSIIFKFDKNSKSAIGAMDDWQVKETTADKTFPLCSFYNEGYDFLGWATEESLATEDPVEYTDGQVLDHVKENGKTTLYAVWEIKHKTVNYYVSYELPNVYESIPADFGSDVPTPTKGDPELLGFTFNGWGKMVKTLDPEFQIEKEYFQYRGEGLGYSLYSANSYNPGDKINTTLYEVMLQPGILVGEENDFYAQFVRQQHKIEFIDKFTEPETKVGEATGYYAYPATPPSDSEIPSHKGYSFTGWYYDKECTLKANSIIFGATDTVLYAGYSINSHKLTINVEETTKTYGKVEFDSPLTELIGPDPTKTGYNFVGWYTDKEKTKENTYTNMPDSDLSLYAKFQIKKITVTYVTNTDEVTIDPTTADYGAALPQPTATLTKTGYSPLGWFEDEALTKPYSFTTYPSENITIYYGWKINSYNITFDVDGKTSTSDPIEYGSSMKDAKPTDPSKVGYDFKGWSMDDTTVFDFNQNMGASDITLKPLWEAVDVDVTIHFETSKLGNPDEFELVNSKTIQMKTGSTLSYSVLDDAQEIVSIEGFTPSSEKSDKATTVKGDGTSEYTVKYIRNKYDVTFIDSEKAELYVEKDVEFGAKLASLNEKIYKKQHTNTYKINDDDTVYSESEFLNALVVNGETTVTVIQTENPGLYFNPKGGLFADSSSGTKTIQSPVGTTCTIPTVSRTGYTFDGWWYDVEGTWHKYEGDTIEMPEGGMEFEARWKANAQTITFKYNDGATQDKVVDTFYDETVNLETPTRTGYTFDGWYEGDNKYNGTSLKVSRDVTFTAHWKVNKITFNFNANGGTGSMDSQELSADSASLKLNANAFTMKGNNFAGWATSATGPVVYEDQETLQLSVFDKLEQTVTLYAVWAKKDITYHFDADNGNDPFDVSGKYGDAFTKPEDPTKEGYTFKGWFSVIDGVMSDNPYQFTTFKVDEESYNLKAKWEINKYKVNFNAGEGKCDTSYIEKNYGETLLLTDLPTASIYGYDFLGWFTSDGTPFSEAFPSGYTYGASDITLVAHYKKQIHTVSYYLDGNDTPYTDENGDAVVQVYEFEDKIEAPIDPNNPFQYFVCWVNELGQMYEFGQPMGIENVKLYAKFLPYTIYFYGEGAEPIFSILSTDLPNDIKTLDVDMIFQLYIKELLNQEAGYQVVISAADAAASEETANLTTIVVYSNILKSTGNDNKAIMSTIVGSDVSAFVDQTENDIPVSTNGKYYSMIMKTADDLVNHQDQVMSDITYFAGKASLSYSHNAVYEALMAAATQGSADAYTLYATYATLLMDRSTIITQMVAGSGQAGLPDEATIKAIVSDMEKYLPYAKNADFINSIADASTIEVPFEMAETIRITASSINEIVTSEQIKYEKNAYRPYSDGGKLFFDGWLEPAITLNDVEKFEATVANMKIEAKFVAKANPVSYINVSKITGSTVTFTWNVVEGAYGYKVKVTVNDVETINELVLTNQITVENLNTNDVVKFEIVAVKQDEKGQIKEFAKVFTATSLVTGEPISSPSDISLSSETKVKNYTHIGSADMGDDVASGDYFYQLKDGQTNNYIFFTGITYDFGAKTIEISDLSDTGIATTSVDPNNKHHILEVGSKIGSFVLKVTDTGVTTTYNCSVYSTVTSVTLGNNLARRENITIEPNAKSENARSATYLGESKDLLSVGIAHTSKKADSYYYSYEYDDETYYNGVKFDIGAVDNFSSFVDKFDADYTFNDLSSGKVLVENVDYIMDDEQDVFYFLSSEIMDHQIQVTVTPKADVEGGYVNHTIPKKFKTNDYSQTSFIKSYVFMVNDGVNVYDDVTLSDAMNTTASNVNILNDINVNMPAKSLVYKEYAKDNLKNEAIKFITLMENDEVVNTCVDIVDYTAEMTKTSGLKCWTIDNVTPLFHDVDGIGYSYSMSGTYAIKNAKWKQNWGNGQFIVVNGGVGNYTNEFNTLGLKSFNPFARYNQSENPLTINGNYFTVDGSNLPSVYAQSSSGVGSMIGAYRIQNIGTALFVNSSKSVMEINDLTINGNTSNLSASVPTEGGSSIAQQMTIASGGVNGIRSVRLSDNDEIADMTSIIVDSVNVNDCLIALYSDAGIDVNYAHVKNCWANGCYGWTRYGNHITSSFRNSFIEGSGGCAIHIDDARFEMCEGGQNTVINPFANLDMQTCRIENFVSGEEQWFKGYGMEIVAMQLKTTIESQIYKESGGTMTILQERTNPVTGAKSEMMNWVFFDKTNDLWKYNTDDHSVPSQGTLYETNPEDMGAQVSFGRNYKDKILVAPETYMNLPEVPGIGQLYAEVDQYGAPVVDALGNVKVVAASYLDANGEIPLINMIPDEKGVLHPMESCMLGFSTMNLANQTIDQETLMSNLYLYFRQFNKALGFGVQGMVQVFPVA